LPAFLNPVPHWADALASTLVVEFSGRSAVQGGCS
jgi:hypothetical protein